MKIELKKEILNALKGYREIVINVCYGGFELSEEAFELYLKKKGITFYKWFPKDEEPIRHFPNYTTIPQEEYERLSKECFERDGDYKKIDAKKLYLSKLDIKRDDDILIEVVKELGVKANWVCSKLKIVKIPPEVDWEIDDYDGMEAVREKHRSWS